MFDDRIRQFFRVERLFWVGGLFEANGEWFVGFAGFGEESADWE